jgi:Zn-dependent M28 family amino/carboxypeptidase
MEPANFQRRTNDSFLFNCHFDSKPGSPGATDNMISCVTMLEIVRVLSAQDLEFQNTLVFLFNGAEELGMQGAHGFVAGWEKDPSERGHPWAETLRAAVNLEGAGTVCEKYNVLGRVFDYQNYNNKHYLTILRCGRSSHPFPDWSRLVLYFQLVSV